jgi:16S rRNA (adenine1518-N6/adenine1519-N6)-dimethyltransferase
LEIGPGLGILTLELCRLYKKVAAVEIDKSFEPILAEIFNGTPPAIIFGDILKIDLPGLIAREFAGLEKIYICANLPYYITTPVILKLVKSPVNFSGITVMIQKEAADKLCSKAGGANYNAAAAAVSYYGEAKKIFSVPKSSFYPPPNVLSAVVKITPHDTPAADPASEDLMYKVIGAAFEQRRKTLANALASGLGLDKKKAADIVKKITNNADIRGEELDIKAFADISDLIFEINNTDIKINT